jgi:hypothetical protein
VAETALRPGIDGEFNFGHGTLRTVADFNIFHRCNANEPSGEKAAWVLEQMRKSGLCKEPATLDFALGRRVFRMDLFQIAARQCSYENETKPSQQLAPA